MMMFIDYTVEYLRYCLTVQQCKGGGCISEDWNHGLHEPSSTGCLHWEEKSSYRGAVRAHGIIFSSEHVWCHFVCNSTKYSVDFELYAFLLVFLNPSVLWLLTCWVTGRASKLNSLVSIENWPIGKLVWKVMYYIYYEIIHRVQWETEKGKWNKKLNY